MRVVNDIKDGILRYYTMVRHKPLPENIQLIKFPVDIRRVYWEKSEKVNFAVNSYVLPEFTGRYMAIVDKEKQHLFTIASDSYLLVTNEEAYWIEQAIAKFIFWKPDNNTNYDFVPYDVYLRNRDRACCSVSIARQIDMNQPEIKDGWFAAITMMNSYNKSIALSYFIGFGNSKHHISLIFPENAIKLKLKKNVSQGLIEQIAEELSHSNGMYAIDQIEQAFAEKIKKLKDAVMDGNMFLAFFCKFFKITKNKIASINDYQQAIERRDFINNKRDLYINLYGANAYAFLLGISDYITHYERRNNIGNPFSNQLQAGQWADDYLKESSKPGFSLYKYIGEEAFNTASWLNTLKVPEETSLFIDN